MSSIPYNYQKYIDDVTKMRQRGTISSGEQVQSPTSAGSRGLARTTDFTNSPNQMMKANMTESFSFENMRDIISRIDRVQTGAEEVQEDLDYRSEDILVKAGFDPMAVKEYMAVFNDTGDTTDIEQMNQSDKIGLADAMSMVLASHGIKNESYEAVQEAPKDSDIDYAKLMLQISAMKDKIAELPIDDDRKTSALTALGQVEDDLAMDEAYEPFPEEDEMTFEDDDAFYEAFGELGFPEDETELFDAEYRGRKVPLNKPMRGDVKKFKVYVKDPKTGNVKKVNFGHGGSSARKAGQKTMKIRKSNPKARKSFRARHNCANPGPKTKARYWSCRKW